MSEVYTKEELEGFTPGQVIQIFLTVQDQYTDSRTDDLQMIGKLKDMVTGLQNELTAASEKIESFDTQLRYAKEHMDMMDTEIAGYTAGIYRRDNMLHGLKKHLEEQSK